MAGEMVAQLWAASAVGPRVYPQCFGSNNQWREEAKEKQRQWVRLPLANRACSNSGWARAF